MSHRYSSSAFVLSIATATLLGWAGAQAAASSAPSTAPDYKIGDKLQTKPAAKSSGARQIEWDDLMPADWDPMKGVQTLQLATLGDGDPRASAALEKLKKAWDEAPVVPAMDKQHVVIAGFAVPLDAEGTSVHEMLLVPYFGACIHTPPPPANQVIHVILPKPAKGVRMMDTVWITGTLHVATATTSLGPSGYQLDGESVAPYRGGAHP
ncbi:MAG: DUF3299 domain-containing protein [Pseudomonadota bacterium]|nr:DUF3299 domain-containing protein [Pseudomonadota bacterium]